MQNFVSSLLKLSLASLLAGSLLSLFGITPRAVLESLGITAGDIQSAMILTIAWIMPRLVMGAFVILPVWFVIYVLLPPRS